MPIADGLNLFLLLVMAHFVADFGLQNDRMAVEKCPGKGVTLPWQWWLGWLSGRYPQKRLVVRCVFITFVQYNEIK